MDCGLPGSSVHGMFRSPGQNAGVGSHSLLQGIFPTQELNPGLLIAGGFFTIPATREAQKVTQRFRLLKRCSLSLNTLVSPANSVDNSYDPVLMNRLHPMV